MGRLRSRGFGACPLAEQAGGRQRPEVSPNRVCGFIMGRRLPPEATAAPRTPRLADLARRSASCRRRLTANDERTRECEADDGDESLNHVRTTGFAYTSLNFVS